MARNDEITEDVHFHKTVTFRAWKHELKFRTSQALFSSHDIDTGTRFLLRTIVEAGYRPFKSILDIGCGYGPLGITLKILCPESAVHLTDRDALAVEYSRRNAELNGLTGVEVYGSLGYDDITRNDFDLIISNIPGKAGEPVVAYLLREARFYLAPGGTAAIVVVSPLEKTVVKILAETPGAETVLRRNRSGHAVFHYRFTGERPPKPGPSAFERGVYRRKDAAMRLDKLEYAMQTAYGMPEFDSLSYDTEILLKALKDIKKEIRRAVAFNPGQGHVPVVLWKLLRPRNITIVDRDLLALRYSKLNLILNGCPAESVSPFHRVGLDMENRGDIDLVAGVLRDENKDAVRLTFDRAAELISPGGMIVLSGSSTPVTRLVTHAETKENLVIKSRQRRRGYSLLVLEKV